MRLDKYISTNYHCTRNRAQFFIEQELVFMNEEPAKKASQDVGDSDIVRIIDDKRVHFVSRSAMKLDAFLDEIKLSIQGKICLDIGASTGGFTQVLLMKEVRSICAVDVGSLQLHPSLRQDSRVTCIENMDIRNFQTDKIFDLIV